MDLVSLGLSNILNETEIEQHHQQMQSMLHTLSMCGTIPPKYRSLILEMTNNHQGRENLIHQWATPSLPAVDTAKIPDFLSNDPPLQQ
eukprot:9742437-Ditylum_brightwellii.AAC.1